MKHYLAFVGILGSLVATTPSYSAVTACVVDSTTLGSILTAASDNSIGGLFNGSRMWAAVVDRSGTICAAAASTSDPTQVWPGSQAIAKSKAYTANAFSLDVLPLSTARLYTFSQPGHSLWSLFGSNDFNPQKGLNPPSNPSADVGQISGGQIYFGGGVPLYQGGKIIGALGVSGDTSCADHEIAKRVRALLGLNPPAGPYADDIVYSKELTNSQSKAQLGAFVHPLCINTIKNGTYMGEELPASGY